MDSVATLEVVFKHLMQRAKFEKCNVNISGDSIWLSDCGFGFDRKYFCVSPKNCDDDDKIARWELPKLKFWQRPKMQIQFKLLAREITIRNMVEVDKAYKEKQLEKEKKAKCDLLKSMGRPNVK
jgi:hypothetical protein